MRLSCGEIYNKHFIANCLQSVPVKKLWKLANNGEDIDKKSKVARFYCPRRMYHSEV